MQRSFTLLLALFAQLTTLSPLQAQEDAPSTSPTPPPTPCTSPDHRAFDFWIGEWDVTQGGQAAGVNHIESIDGGCALLERWTSARGNFTGHSLNSFNRADGQWHQTWVDSGGTLLKLSGGRVAGSGPMVLEGEAPGPDGTSRPNRISWTPNADGSVRQHWEVHDGGAWSTVFDGEYRRRNTAQ